MYEMFTKQVPRKCDRYGSKCTHQSYSCHFHFPCILGGPGCHTATWWNTALGESSEKIAARYAGCSTIFCTPFLSGQRKRLVSFSFDFCAHATAWFWFRLLRIHPTLLGWKVLLRQASSTSNSNCQLIFYTARASVTDWNVVPIRPFFSRSPFCFLHEYGGLRRDCQITRKKATEIITCGARPTHTCVLTWERDAQIVCDDSTVGRERQFGHDTSTDVLSLPPRFDWSSCGRDMAEMKTNKFDFAVQLVRRRSNKILLGLQGSRIS